MDKIYQTVVTSCFNCPNVERANSIAECRCKAVISRKYNPRLLRLEYDEATQKHLFPEWCPLENI